MRAQMSQISIALIAVVIGIAIVGQLRSQERPTELTSLPVAELSTRIQTLSDANAQLRAALAEHRDLLADYEASGAQGVSALDVSREELRRIRAFAGLSPVVGQGIVVNVTGSLDAIAVNDLINELRNAGAEAMALDETRITAASVVAQGARSLEIDGVAFDRTFTLLVIGDSDGLIAALERPGGIVTQLEQFVSATITVSPSSDLQLPATLRDLTPEAGIPVE
jgi:uncharacterized protein YlxW (UPF0749 family)